MARIRSIKPEFWTSEQVMDVSPLARLSFIGVWTFCDDRGVHPASTKTLKAEVFPGDESPTITEIAQLVEQLLRVGLLRPFEVLGKQYWLVTGWHKHQRIDKPTYRHPPPPDSATSTRPIGEAAPSDERPIGEPSAAERSGGEWSGQESKGLEGKVPVTHPPKKTAIAPDFEISVAVTEWAAAKGFDKLSQHLEAFVAKCTAKGYLYANHDAAFKEAIRTDWANLRTPKRSGSDFGKVSDSIAMAAPKEIRDVVTNI